MVWLVISRISFSILDLIRIGRLSERDKKLWAQLVVFRRHVGSQQRTHLKQKGGIWICFENGRRVANAPTSHVCLSLLAIHARKVKTVTWYDSLKPSYNEKYGSVRTE